MTDQIRVLVAVDLRDVDAAVAEQMTAQVSDANRERSHRAGCLQYETYRSASNADHVHIVELWESMEAFDAHWRVQSASTTPEPPAGIRIETEFYKRQVMESSAGHWQSIDPQGRSAIIRWP
ncbi:putative quinol monooxygenase [Subtercola endophyticus]|uniref:putative quinol monooxygenase n=1 Tax=Subtercola endophyticus TaxID=2895559 RepID=UPI001E4B818A|nr:antibiotic biosynthesis monooxygenase [Subtercola endophyticus]UFS58778.1 antibiotic biosynthesis monooxygenase [Subtercola endophyticus]